ncbi:methyltransferase, FkbM family [Agrobacterium sp. DSM 25558]|uniref:FkbM family methyltransferase n=1 Tax=Agrobacterium sp. DSM 25558 TaxID=1907665 RepID=UPI000972650C|nr:FkbM family methyltransferase [Agrobacterium sp. DSM 25558]SCX20329.1 methyltransferase, FkbM family [Agrobacterium sp. DSM 25558]
MVRILPRKLRRSLSTMKHVASHVGWRAAILQAVLPKNRYYSASVDDVKLTLRARSPDLQVAIECLHNEYNFLSDYLDDKYDMITIDAGGYIGTAAIALSRKLPRSRIITIEPASENLDILLKNVSSFENIEVRRAALTGRTKNHVSLRNRKTGQWGFTIVAEPEDHSQAKEIESVPSISIDKLLSGLDQKVGFLKLDIEGGEKELFESGSTALSAIPFIFVELHDHIISGCSEAFFNFSLSRQVIRFSGEKYLSIRL